MRMRFECGEATELQKDLMMVYVVGSRKAGGLLRTITLCVSITFIVFCFLRVFLCAAGFRFHSVRLRESFLELKCTYLESEYASGILRSGDSRGSYSWKENGIPSSQWPHGYSDSGFAVRSFTNVRWRYKADSCSHGGGDYHYVSVGPLKAALLWEVMSVIKEAVALLQQWAN